MKFKTRVYIYIYITKITDFCKKAKDKCKVLERQLAFISILIILSFFNL